MLCNFISGLQKVSNTLTHIWWLQVIMPWALCLSKSWSPSWLLQSSSGSSLICGDSGFPCFRLELLSWLQSCCSVGTTSFLGTCCCKTSGGTKGDIAKKVIWCYTRKTEANLLLNKLKNSNKGKPSLNYKLMSLKKKHSMKLVHLFIYLRIKWQQFQVSL